MVVAVCKFVAIRAAQKREVSPWRTISRRRLFSLERARGEGSDVKPQLASVKSIRKVSEFVVELETSAPNPILPELLTNVLIMNRAWAVANQAARPVDRRRGIENAASFRANGTGPFGVRERQPGTRTVLQRSLA